MDNLVKRFIEYVKVDTESDTETGLVPSTPGQLFFAKQLVEELKSLGLENVSIDENAYVMATLASNIDKDVPVVGFLSHMDTSPDFSGKNVKPQFVENYDGKDIVLHEEKNIILKTEDFPELKHYVGETLITTDGTTLLGADDKAGIAEIITAMEYLINNPDIKHGQVNISFTIDEEIGKGADFFNVKKFACDFAYTLDGGEIGELEYENFNAAYAEIVFKGRNVHPGTAKDKMVNSIHLSREFASLFPEQEVPEHTEGYEGFYHLIASTGSVEESKLQYIIRDFDMAEYKNRKAFVSSLVAKFADKYGSESIDLKMTDQYFNMKEKIEPVKYIVDIAEKAILDAGVTPKIIPIRGGTDGSRLSYMGLPCPNIFAGGHNFHGRFEFVPVNSMHKAVDVIVNIVKAVAEL